MPDMPTLTITVNQIVWGLFLLVLLAGACVASWICFRAWQLSMQAWLAKLDVGTVQLLLLRMRGTDIVQVVNAGILAKRDGVDVTIDQLAHHHLAGGNIRMVVTAMLSAKRFNLPLTFERAATIDLMGRDPVQLVSEAVYEANQIRITQPAGTSGILKDALAPITPHTITNSAAVLLQASPGMIGVVMGQPRVEAQLHFPQGDLQVLVRCTTLPRAGDRLAVVQVDGMTVMVEPVGQPDAASTPSQASGPASTPPAAPPFHARA